MLVKLADPAVDDLREIANWLHEHFPDWLARTQQRLRDAFELLATYPAIGREGKVAGTRELTVARTPYLLVYSAIDDEIWVLRILHGAKFRPPESET